MMTIYTTPPENVNGVNPVVLSAHCGIPRSCGGLRALNEKGTRPTLACPYMAQHTALPSAARIPCHPYDGLTSPLQVGRQPHSRPGNIQFDRDGDRDVTFRILFHGAVDVDADNSVSPHEISPFPQLGEAQFDTVAE
jgi:hypothetical protein